MVALSILWKTVWKYRAIWNRNNHSNEQITVSLPMAPTVAEITNKRHPSISNKEKSITVGFNNHNNPNTSLHVQICRLQPGRDCYYPIFIYFCWRSYWWKCSRNWFVPSILLLQKVIRNQSMISWDFSYSTFYFAPVHLRIWNMPDPWLTSY